MKIEALKYIKALSGQNPSFPGSEIKKPGLSPSVYLLHVTFEYTRAVNGCILIETQTKP